MDFDECHSQPCLNGAICTDSTFEPPCDRYGDIGCCEAEAVKIPVLVPGATLLAARMTLRLLYGLHCTDSLWAEPTGLRRVLQSEVVQYIDMQSSESQSASESWLDAERSASDSGSWDGSSSPYESWSSSSSQSWSTSGSSSAS